jgi:hypothetical protein
VQSRSVALCALLEDCAGKWKSKTRWSSGAPPSAPGHLARVAGSDTGQDPADDPGRARERKRA